MTVKVRTILALKKILGSAEIEQALPEGATLGNLVAVLVDQWGEGLASQLYEPDRSTLRPYIRLMVNGRDIAFLNGLETVLHPADEVLILPPVSGG